MYAAFFGLQHPPFSIAPDPRYLFLSERHREALAHLLYGLDGGGGFVLLTGEVGTGKTTVCRCFLQQIPRYCTAAYIFNPRLTALELLGTICDEFCVPHPAAVPGSPSVKDCIDPLNAFLLRQHAAGRSCVLIIDEAQSLAPEVLEQLRLLTNLETDEKKLLQIILIGQPELREMVASPGLTQLAQRVIARYHLGPLGAAATQDYVAHRLAIAGWQGPLPFARKALRRVHALTGGVPRRINLLCDRALLGAYAAGEREVSEATLQRAAREVFGAGKDAPAPRGRTGTAVLGAVAGAALVLLVLLGVWLVAGGRDGGVAAALAPRAARPVPPVPAPPAAATLDQWLARQPYDVGPVWRSLARMWQAQVPGNAQPCEPPLPDGLRCWRASAPDAALLRRLDRPALLTLARGGAAPPATVLLRALAADRATLEGADGTRFDAPLPELALRWQGAWLTLWKGPPQQEEAGGDIAATPDGARWLELQLDAAGIADARTLRARVQQFQRAQELAPDGLADPVTVMALNRVLRVNEPRLSSGAEPPKQEAH